MILSIHYMFLKDCLEKSCFVHWVIRCSVVEQEMSKSKKGAGCMLIFRKSSVIYEGLTFWNVQYYGTSTLKNNVFLVTCESYAQRHSKHTNHISSVKKYEWLGSGQWSFESTHTKLNLVLCTYTYVQVRMTIYFCLLFLDLH